MKPTRNNRGKSHENGSIEASHGHFKNRLHQALLLRNSTDFDSVESYQQFIEKVVEGLKRVYASADSGKRRARCVNYRHVIESLRKKPRAFLQYRWRDEILPNDYYRSLWAQLLEQFDPYQAARLMVEGLYFAAVLDKKTSVGYWMNSELKKGSLTLVRLQQQFAPPPLKPLDTHWVEQHPLSQYDQLLNHDYPKRCTRNSSPSAKRPYVCLT